MPQPLPRPGVEGGHPPRTIKQNKIHYYGSQTLNDKEINDLNGLCEIIIGKIFHHCMGETDFALAKAYGIINHIKAH
jgi:hypothetical protein